MFYGNFTKKEQGTYFYIHCSLYNPYLNDIDIGEAYRKLLAYADEHQITLAEEFLEVYTVDQLMAETVEEYVTEISVRICGGDMDEL